MKALLKKHASLVDIGSQALQKRFPDLAPAIRASDRAFQTLERRVHPPCPRFRSSVKRLMPFLCIIYWCVATMRNQVKMHRRERLRFYTTIHFP